MPRASVTATISASSFNTGNRHRDGDVRSAKFLHADAYPELTFQAQALDQAHGRWMLTGELTVRNVRQPMTLAIESVKRTDDASKHARPPA